jgi:poly-beta-1,6-N-acetyl-D-glucosamine synthase
VLIVAVIGSFMLAIVISVYGTYFFKVLRNNSLGLTTLQNPRYNKDTVNLPPISIIVSTFNEASVIQRKIENLSSLRYPKSLLEILVCDDASNDATAALAEKTIAEKNLNGKVICNPNRIGLNRSLNLAIAKATNNLICITDSDVLLEEDALNNAVSVLQKNQLAGGVTGHIQPVFQGQGITQESETAYRGFYHSSMLAESALHSAFPGNGPLIIFDKSKVPNSIPDDYGSTDGNIAMNIIRQGLRFLYVPTSIVYEPSAENLRQHRMQKIRRAKRLIQVFLRNRDIAFNKRYGSFGCLIFPLKLFMLAICPTLLLVGFSLLLIAVMFSQSIPLYFLLVVSFVTALIVGFFSKRFTGLVSSFLFHQLYLVIGLLFSFKKSVFWKTIDRSTKLELKNNEVS